MKDTLKTSTYELKIYTDSPWEATLDVDIMNVLTVLYDRKCPYILMKKVLDEFESTDKALVFCGSFDQCYIGHKMFEEAKIKSKIQEV